MYSTLSDAPTHTSSTVSHRAPHTDKTKLWWRLCTCDLNWEVLESYSPSDFTVKVSSCRRPVSTRLSIIASYIPTLCTTCSRFNSHVLQKLGTFSLVTYCQPGFPDCLSFADFRRQFEVLRITPFEGGEAACDGGDSVFDEREVRLSFPCDKFSVLRTCEVCGLHYFSIGFGLYPDKFELFLYSGLQYETVYNTWQYSDRPKEGEY